MDDKLPADKPQSAILDPTTRRRWLYALLLFLLMGTAFHFTIQLERDKLLEKQRAHAALFAANLVSRLENSLDENVFLANGLTAYLLTEQELDEERVEATLKTIYRSGNNVRNVGLAPGNRLSYLYPLEGNEEALGLYYPDHPQQWPSVQRAIKERKTILSGPVELVQGGMGFISRTPVFDGRGDYWGIVSMVLDSRGVLSALESLKGAKEMHFALRGKDGNGAKGEAFWGDPQLFEGNPVTTMVSIPGGSWQLAVSPAAGWQTNPYSLLILEGIGLLLIALLTLLLLSYHEGRQHTAASERRLRAFLETSQDAIIVTDDTGLIQEFNPTAELLFGYTKDEMTGTSINRLMAQRDATTHDHHLAAAKGLPPHHMAQQREIQGRRKDGTMVPLEITVGQTLVDNKTIFVGAIRDISDRKALEQRLLELASTDPLTQAANRRAFLTTATQSLQEAKRHGRGWSMLMLDADHFKRINDSHGHQTGDLVLQQLAQTMRDCLRESDILGRFGGEEFAIALPETSSKQAESLAARLLDAVRELRIQASNGQTIQVTVSIGIASLGAETEDLESLTKQADDALYAAKADGRNRYCSAVDMPMLL